MKQEIIKRCLTALVFVAVAIFSQACSRGEPAAGNSGATNTVSNSTLEKINWTADEKRYQGEFDTNGLSCDLQIFCRSHYGELPQLICEVCTFNTSTNLFDWCWKGNKTNLMKIELLNSEGKPVEKTAEGLKYGSFLTEQQYEAFFKSGKRPAFLRGYAFIPSDAGVYHGGYGLDSFSIPELFKITQPGEYTLQVQIRMGQMEFPEKKLKRLIMPPEVSAKIQIRSGVIFPTNPSATGSTNSPAR
jgi:hypothetical protein